MRWNFLSKELILELAKVQAHANGLLSVTAACHISTRLMLEEAFAFAESFTSIFLL